MGETRNRFWKRNRSPSDVSDSVSHATHIMNEIQPDLKVETFKVNSSIGVASGFLAAIVFAGMAVATREAAIGLPASQIMLLRSIFAVSLVALLDRRSVVSRFRRTPCW